MKNVWLCDNWFLKTIQTLSCWYSCDSSSRVFSFARISILFSSFCIISYWQQLATSSLSVKSQSHSVSANTLGCNLTLFPWWRTYTLTDRMYLNRALEFDYGPYVLRRYLKKKVTPPITSLFIKRQVTKVH